MEKKIDEERLIRIGSKIVYYRRLRKMKQIDLATATGISEAYLSRIERGKNPTGGSLLVILNIAQVLGVDISELTKNEDIL